MLHLICIVLVFVIAVVVCAALIIRFAATTVLLIVGLGAIVYAVTCCGKAVWCRLKHSER